MSSEKFEMIENSENKYQVEEDLPVLIPSQRVTPSSNFFKKSLNKDIYSGHELIPFKDRHPIFKSLLRIEFEDVLKEYLKII